MDELKRCPFCGGEITIYAGMTKSGGVEQSGGCRKCNWTMFLYSNDVNDLVKALNTRDSDTTHVETLKGEIKLINAKCPVPDGWTKVPMSEGESFLTLEYPSGEKRYIDMIERVRGKEAGG
jgi:hypothetical protein